MSMFSMRAHSLRAAAKPLAVMRASVFRLPDSRQELAAASTWLDSDDLRRPAPIPASNAGAGQNRMPSLSMFWRLKDRRHRHPRAFKV